MLFVVGVIWLGFEYIIISEWAGINKGLRLISKSLFVIYMGGLSYLGFGWLLRREFWIIIYENGGWIYGVLLFVLMCLRIIIYY